MKREIMKFNKTVVTACDSNYVWGAYILISSLCYNHTQCFIKVLGVNLKQNEIKILEQFPNTQVTNIMLNSKKNVCLLKPLAIYLADTEFITWMDADCFILGDVSDFLEAKENHIQIRFRSVNENMGVYHKFLQRNDKIGDIPKQVLKKWKTDVNENDKTAINTVSQTNCFVINIKNLDLIKNWENQIEKVIPSDFDKVYNKKNPAYFMTDESVLNSIFAFKKHNLIFDDFKFDLDRSKYLVHFGLNPKPWISWNYRSIKFYNELLKTLKFYRNLNFDEPTYSRSLNDKYKIFIYFKTYLCSILPKIKIVISYLFYNYIKRMLI